MRVRLIVRASYQNRPNEICDLLLSIVKAHESVRTEPEPLVFLDQFGESSMHFELFVWLDNLDGFKRVPSELRCTIWDAFKERGIEIPFPQQDLHLRSIDGVDPSIENESWSFANDRSQRETNGHEREMK